MGAAKSFFQLRYLVLLFIAVTFDALQLLFGVAIFIIFSTPGIFGAIVGCTIAGSVAGQAAIVGGGATAGAAVGAAIGVWAFGIGALAGAAIGGAAGALLSGATLAYNQCMAGAIVGTGVQLTADFFSGGAFQGLLMGVGTDMAAIIDFCFSTIGIAILYTAFVFLHVTKFTELFHLKRSVWSLLKLVPGFDILPFFTAMVVVTILEKEGAKAAGKIHPVAGAAVGLGAAALGGLGAAKAALQVAKGVRTEEEARQAGRVGGEIAHGGISSREELGKRTITPLHTPQMAFNRVMEREQPKKKLVQQYSHIRGLLPDQQQPVHDDAYAAA